MTDEIIGPGGKLREITPQDRIRRHRFQAVWTPCDECGHSWLAHSRSVGCLTIGRTKNAPPNPVTSKCGCTGFIKPVKAAK